MFINNDFILASSSRSRKDMFKKIGLKFKSTPPLCNESLLKRNMLKVKKSPKTISRELSKIKAKSISVIKKNKLVVGSDTTIDLLGSLVDKVSTLKDAKEKLKKLSGKTHIIYSSGSAYFNGVLVWQKTCKTSVKIRKLKKKEIQNYLKNTGEQILKSAGCYQIEKKGPIIIEKIKGDFFNVMGFPLFDFLIFLKKNEYKK